MRSRLFALALATAVTLATPARLRAQSITLGSPLAVDPNFSIGCEAQPMIADSDGTFALFNSGVADCTWRQSGVFGAPAGDPRFSSVPGDGRITSVSVRSGPTPAPLSFVIFRQISSPGGGDIIQCCFYVGESGLLQPQPNSVTTFAVNLPVQRNTINGAQVVDLIGISAQSGTGTLPLFSTGRNNAFQLTEPGSVNSGFFYPRIGSIPNDSGGGRREEALPGIEVLMQWTWCPASAGPFGCGGGGGAGPALRNAVAPVAGGAAPIDLICNGDAVCRGLLELLGTARGRAAGSRVPRYGKRKFTLQAGANGIFSIKLSGKAKRLLRQSSEVPVTLRLTPKNGTAFTADVTLTH